MKPIRIGNVIHMKQRESDTTLCGRVIPARPKAENGRIPQACKACVKRMLEPNE